MNNVDGTLPWPDDLSPVDKVALALADVARARAHVTAARTGVDAAMRELERAVARLVDAARGGH